MVKEDMVVVHMTTALDTERLAEYPPQLIHEVADDMVREAELATLYQRATDWDLYQKITQLSFMEAKHFTHIIVCDGKPEIANALRDNRTLITVNSEAELVAAAVQVISGTEGQWRYNKRYTGWHIRAKIWPTLALRAARYRLPPLAALQMDIKARWPQIDNLVDLENIYTQGYTRRGFPNILDFIGYMRDIRLPELPEDVGQALCSPGDSGNVGTGDSVLNIIEDYLSIMGEITIDYLGLISGRDTAAGCGKLI